MTNSPWFKSSFIPQLFMDYLAYTKYCSGTEDIAKNKTNEVYILVGIYNKPAIKRDRSMLFR